MTTHPTPAERVLAMLEDEQTIESLPAAEVREDLTAVGIDPARSIAFARALAGGAGTPGGRLLGAIDLAEEDEEEIARLEKADIEEVRAQIPQGTAAAIAAEARRRAGEDSSVVAMKPRRRSRILTWGGPAAGIAASILIFGFIGLHFLSGELEVIFNTTSSYLASPGSGGGAPKEYLPEEAPSTPLALAEPEPAEAKQEEKSLAPPPSMQPEADTERSRQMAPAAAPEQLAKRDRPDESADLRQESGAAKAPAVGAEGFALESEVADTATAAQDEALAGEGALARNVEPPALRAMLVVDPAQVPMKLQSQALPDSGLQARVAEAQALAGERPVIALYRLQTGSAQMDFAQVPLQVGLTQQMAAPSPLTDLMGDDARNYDFIRLPAE